jgi:hypothetical protein
MKWHIKLMLKLIILTCVLCCIDTTGFAVTTPPVFHNYSKDVVLEYFLNYPFVNNTDIQTFHERLGLFLFLMKNFPGNDEQQTIFSQLSAFTTTVPENGEQISLVIFSRSQNQALKRLRDEIRLSPPKGGAIIRVYPSKEAMPFPIRSLLNDSAQGITEWCRFIAVNAENKSPEELDDIVSHELVHAYIASYLGVKNNRLPQWFNEGLALYLSSSKDQYVAPWGLNWQLTSRVTDDYAEYHLVFRYLDSKLGRRGMAEFIHQVIAQRTVDAPLHRTTGLDSYDRLRDKALQWQSYQQNMSSLRFTILFFLALLWGGWILYRKQLFRQNSAQKQADSAKETAQLIDQQIADGIQQRADSTSAEKLEIVRHQINSAREQKALVIIEEGRALVKLGRRADALNLFEEALQIAGWSSKVTDAVQQARDEMDGIIV